MKTKISQIISKGLLFAFIVLLGSCNYLDVDQYFDDTLKFDSVFTQKRYFEAYLWGAAGQLPDESRIFGHEYAPGITASDDIFTVMSSDIFRGSAFALGYVNPDNLRGMNVWSDMYKVIRKANLMLARMDECQDMTALDRRNYTGYIHFLRGYAYYHILMTCGPAYYINQNYSEEKWALAAAACKRVIDMNVYELFTVSKDQNTPQLPAGVPTENFPNGAGGIDPFKSYSHMFTGDEPFKNNNEVIWGRISEEVKGYTQQSFPQYMGGYNGMGLTQKMIDAYRMEDGKTIEEAMAVGEYKEGPNDFTSGPRDFSDYHLNGNIWQMYANREMRFYACVGFNGCYWPATSTTDGSYRLQTVKYCMDGNAGKYAGTVGSDNYTPTGYVIKKYISSYDAWRGNSSERYEKGFPIIRYAEILLSYAEALNQLTTTHAITLPTGESYSLSRDVDEMAKAFNQVRYRAGLPGLTQAQLESPTEMFEQIKRERMVEFLGEGRRFYDVRRWGIYEDVDSEPIMGLNIAANEFGGFYQRTVVDEKNYRDRVVHRKLLFLPISKSELRKVELLDQNPGYNN